MTKLRRIFATCILVFCLSGVAFADDGDPAPPPPGETQGPGHSVLTNESQDLSTLEPTASDLVIATSEAVLSWVISVF